MGGAVQIDGGGRGGQTRPVIVLWRHQLGRCLQYVPRPDLRNDGHWRNWWIELMSMFITMVTMMVVVVMVMIMANSADSKVALAVTGAARPRTQITRDCSWWWMISQMICGSVERWAALGIFWILCSCGGSDSIEHESAADIGCHA